MPTCAEAWLFLSDYFAQILQERWDSVTISTETTPPETFDQRYQISRDSAARFRVGYAPPDLSIADLLRRQFGLDYPELAAADGFGFVFCKEHEPGFFPNKFPGRLVTWFPSRFRNRECVWPPVYFSCRRTDLTPPKSYGADKKFLHHHLPEGEKRPLFLDPDPRARTLLVEGPFHAMKLVQEGFAATAFAGEPNDEQFKLLRRCEEILWLPDVDVLAGKPGEFVSTENGKQFRDPITVQNKLTAFLTRWRKLPAARVCRYPSDFQTAHDHGDVNDWFRLHPDPADFLFQIIGSAFTLDEAEVESIPPDVGPERSRRVSDLLTLIARKPPLDEGPILKHLAKHLHLGSTELTPLKHDIKRQRSEGVPLQESDSIRDFSKSCNTHFLRAGQDFVRGQLYYTVWKKELRQKFIKGEKVIRPAIEPFIISSGGDFFPATEEELIKRDLMFYDEGKPCIKTFGWADQPDVPYSLPAFLADPAANVPKTSELYEELRRHWQRYLFLNLPGLYDFNALHTFIGYCITIFPAYGILGLNGTRETGKSLYLDILVDIAFNPIKASSISPSAFFRTASTLVPTLLWDEAESMHSLLTVNNQVDEKQLLVNDCYRAKGAAIRCAGEDIIPTTYKTFCCVGLANTKGLNPTTATRAFIYPMNKRPKDAVLDEYDSYTTEEICSSLRNRLYCWVLSHAAQIHAMFLRLQCGDLAPFLTYWNLRDREKEIWTPLFALAFLIDSECGRPFKFDPPETLAPDRENTIVGRLLTAMQYLLKVKHEILIARDFFPTFITAIRQILYAAMEYEQARQMDLSSEVIQDLRDRLAVDHYRNDEGPEDKRLFWFSTDGLFKYLKQLQGLKFVKESGNASVGHMLKIMGKVISDEDDKRLRIGKRRLRCVRLNYARVQEVCEEYGIAADAEVDLSAEAAEAYAARSSRASPAVEQEQTDAF